MLNADTLQRFMFENSNIRGTLVHLRATYLNALQHVAYPDRVAQELGQGLAASALLSDTIKFVGSLIIQIQGQGAVNMLVAQCTHDRHIRGLARWHDDKLNDPNRDIYDNGRLTITVNTDRTDERYQSVIALNGATLGDSLEAYFNQSEQLPTRLWLAADNDQVVGMSLQQLPQQAGTDSDLWDRVDALSATLTQDELLKLTNHQLLHRLFHEEDVRLFDPEPVSFRCSCTREKIVTVIRALGKAEAQSLLEEQGDIQVSCDFCNHSYMFDAVDVEEIFTGAASSLPPSTTRH